MDWRASHSQDEAVAALSRSADRDSLFMQATLTIEGQGAPVQVRVRNLSSGGMLAESPVAVSAGTSLSVELRNVGTVAGRVVWVGEGKFGIAFARPVNPHAVRRQITQKGNASAYAPAASRQGLFHRRG